MGARENQGQHSARASPATPAALPIPGGRRAHGKIKDGTQPQANNCSKPEPADKTQKHRANEMVKITINVQGYLCRKGPQSGRGRPS